MRCVRCRMHFDLCICALIPRLETRTRIVLLLHRREEAKSTNTGRLALQCLPNSELRVRGHEGQPDLPLQLAPGVQPLLLFPAADAQPIERWRDGPQPLALVVPDGTWRQAARMRRRTPGLDLMPCVTLPPGPPTRYRLRSETHEGRLATIEAIARALGVLEGDEVRVAIERVFDAMVTRSLRASGSVSHHALD